MAQPQVRRLPHPSGPKRACLNYVLDGRTIAKHIQIFTSARMGFCTMVHIVGIAPNTMFIKGIGSAVRLKWSLTKQSSQAQNRANPTFLVLGQCQARSGSLAWRFLPIDRCNSSQMFPRISDLSLSCSDSLIMSFFRRVPKRSSCSIF